MKGRVRSLAGSTCLTLACANAACDSRIVSSVQGATEGLLRLTLLAMLSASMLACNSQIAFGQARTNPARNLAPPQAAGPVSPAPAASKTAVAPENIAPLPVETGDEGPAPAAPSGPLDLVGTKPAEDTEDAIYHRIGIEDPSRSALAAFHSALRRAGRGRGQARIVFYGASHVAGEMFTGPLRQALQMRFGEAGPGFVALAKPFSWYRHTGINVDEGRGFKVVRVKTNSITNDAYGLLGVAMDAKRGRPARSAVETLKQDGLDGRASQFALYYLRQPKGGRISVYLDGEHRQDISTDAPHTETGYARFEASDALHRFELRTNGDGPVRVFGLAIERSQPGVILDTLGLPGARARDQLLWEDGVYREHLSSRMPDLVVLAYGTNESGDDRVPIAQYEQSVRRVLERVRDVVPYASCLLIGPSDRPKRGPGSRWSDRPLTDAIIETQRRVAAESGCGFFDLRAFMGGKMAMVRWVKASPPLGAPDHVHFTNAGYERLATVLYDALLAGFDHAPPPAQSASLAASPAGAEAPLVRAATAAPQEELPVPVR
jgi:lysophospholipase L1-like esterase/ribosomal protein L13E